jgi:hypothetical protein
MKMFDIKIICFYLDISFCCSCQWDETKSLNCGQKQTYHSSPRWEPQWYDTDRGKLNNSREKSVPVPLCPQQIPD